MSVLCLNLYYDEVCYKGTALYVNLEIVSDSFLSLSFLFTSGN